MTTIFLLALSVLATLTRLVYSTIHLDSYQDRKPGSGDKLWSANGFNITTLLNSQVKLPCYIEKGRKFIWMQTTRHEILSIDSNLITSDKRFSIESTKKCGGSHFSHRKTLIKLAGSNHSESVKKNGCWSNLVINDVNLSDEGVYLCQIDTMSSSKVYLNILG